MVPADDCGRSNGWVPNAPTINARGSHGVLHDRVVAELLCQDGELRAVFVHADVCAAHPALPVECRTAVQDAVVVDHCETSQQSA